MFVQKQPDTSGTIRNGSSVHLLVHNHHFHPSSSTVGQQKCVFFYSSGEQILVILFLWQTVSTQPVTALQKPPSYMTVYTVYPRTQWRDDWVSGFAFSSRHHVLTASRLPWIIQSVSFRRDKITQGLRACLWFPNETVGVAGDSAPLLKMKHKISFSFFVVVLLAWRYDVHYQAERQTFKSVAADTRGVNFRH